MRFVCVKSRRLALLAAFVVVGLAVVSVLLERHDTPARPPAAM